MKVSNVLKFLATGSFTLLLSACYGTIQVMYGVPMDISIPLAVRVTNSEKTPIPGIQVSFKSLEREVLTNEEGLANLEFYPDEEVNTIICKDIDGDSNGSYIDKEITIDFEEEETQVTLESKDNE